METEEITKDNSTNNWFRRPPTQRQTWDDKEGVPHVNWGDMFFDLFYVAAAYNLADIIKSSLNLISLLYFLGCFGPITSIWMNKMLYDSRFQTPDDIFHVILEIVHLCILAGAVLHIRPPKYMSQGESFMTMLMFCLFVWLGNLYNVFSYLEIRFWGVTGQQKIAKYSSVTSICEALIPFFFTTVATLYSLIVYVNANGYSVVTRGGDGGDHDDKDVHHIPIILLVIAWMTRMVAKFPVDYLRGRGKAPKEITVPENVEFVIHRCGEWTMLMLGESVLSLLIVPVLKGEFRFYSTFFVGVLSVTCLQFLYFKSQPHHADEHALKKTSTRLAGAIFTAMLQLYSAGLILVGVSYKMVLNEFKIDEVKAEKIESGADHRLLAPSGGGPLPYSRDEVQQRIAYFFCLSLAAVFVFLDALTLSHAGIKSSINRCFCQEKSHLLLKGVAFVVIFRVGINVFIGTVCLYITSPDTLAIFGLISISLQVVIRLIGNVFLPSHHAVEVAHDDHEEPNQDKGEDILDDDNQHWPNVTQPVVVEHKNNGKLY